jgi:DNA modification methylase
MDWKGKNLLCFGDNLGFLRDAQLFGDECIDLIYLDPPFNSQQSYNVLFKEAAGTPAAAQIKAFEDTWKWDLAANEALTQIHTDPAVPASLVELMKTFMNFLRPSPMFAYLVQMAIRLVHMHRILKPTGSLYLHCDPTASHYLKLVLDAIFGPGNFRNEITWQRTGAHSDANRWGRVSDIILFFTKSDEYTWNTQYVPYEDEYVKERYHYKDDNTGRLFWPNTMTAAGPGPSRIFRGKEMPPPKGTHWRFSQENIDLMENEDRIYYSANGMPYVKCYLDEQKGKPIQNIWTDIRMTKSGGERLGYPTQKPLELLRRIVSASSNPGDVVMDPFCGCGTTIDAVETLNREGTTGVSPVAETAKGQTSGPGPSTGGTPVVPRRWIGIDVTHLSINLIKHRLTRFDNPPVVYEVLGEPASVSGAEALAQDDPFQFQFWALGLIGARPRGAVRKKGADQGIDGVRYFQDEPKNGAWVTKTMLVQVKSGKVGAKDIRDFVGTLSREKAEMGVFLTLQGPTDPMKAEAASAGLYVSPWDNKPYPKVQVLTIQELLADPYRPNPRCLRVPAGYTQHTLAEAPKHRPGGAKNGKLFEPEKER